MLCRVNLGGQTKVGKRLKVGDKLVLKNGVEYELGQEIDLEKEVFLLSNGERLTNALVAEIADCDCCRKDARLTQGR